MATRKTPVKKQATKKSTPRKKAAPKKAAPKQEEPVVQPEPEQISAPAPEMAEISESAPAPREADDSYLQANEAAQELPTPQELEAAEAALQDDSGIQVEELPPATQPLAVGEEEVSVAALTPEKRVGDMDSATIRALVDLDSPPIVGEFNFASATGRDARFGKPVRGKFRNGLVFTVPNYVALYVIERDWAMRV